MSKAKKKIGRAAKIQQLPIFTDTQEMADAFNELISNPGFEITFDGKEKVTARAFVATNSKQGKKRFDVEIDAGLFLEVSHYRDIFSKKQIQVGTEALELWLLFQKFLVFKGSDTISFSYHSVYDEELKEILNKYIGKVNFKYEDRSNKLLTLKVHTLSKITIENYNQIVSSSDLIKLSRIAEFSGGLEVILPKK